jgi:CHAD domain-containing protein
VRQRSLRFVEEAEGILDVGDAPLGEAAVHDLRVLCKRLRAVWQLLTPALGRDRTRQPEQALRAAARSLASHREAHVARRTIERLARRHAHDDEERAALRALAPLVAQRWPEAQAEPSLAAPLRDAFAAQRTALTSLPADLEEADLAAGLLRSYVRAREQGRRAALLREAAAWHRCRRWAKYELYQLELLAPSHPDGRRAQRLSRLGETLGRFNDLCTLRSVAEQGRTQLLHRGAAVSVVRILAREERSLRARMERRFARLYAQGERERARRIRRLLARNRAGTGPGGQGRG